MKKFFLFCFFCLGFTLSSQTVFARAFPETRSTAVSVFADQLPMQNMTEAQIRFAAENYAGTQKLYTKQVDKLRAYNPDFLLLHYRLAEAAGPAAGIAHDSLEDNVVDGNAFSDEEWENNLENKDWFIKNDAGVKLRNTSWNWYPFDLARSAALRNDVADYWIGRVTKEVAATKSDGVFADSFGLIFGPWQASGAKSYMFDSNWNLDISDSQSWLANTLVPYSDRTWAILQQNNIAYIPNCGQLITSWDTIENYTHSDGCMIEGFTGFNESIETESDWELEMNNVLALANKGKITIAQTDFSSLSDSVRRSFIVGSYLISKGDKSYVNMFAAQNDGVELQWFPEYDVPLGAFVSLPKNVSELRWQGVFRRDFASGFVLVNPYNERKNISLGNTYSLATFFGGGVVASTGARPGEISYRSVTAVALEPRSAAFLLTDTAPLADNPGTPASCPLTIDRAYKTANDRAVYYVDNDCKKRPFRSATVFFTYFDSWSDVSVVSSVTLGRVPAHELGFMPLGPKYDPKYGALVKTVIDPKVYLLINNKKYWITSEMIFNDLRYDWSWIEDIDKRLLDKYPSAGEITDTTRHVDGTIIKYFGDPRVYILENGEKRHIADEYTFNSLGYRADRIVTISSNEQYADGLEIDNTPRIRLYAR